jgi:alpha-1,4-digalacturonate transport system substrate-binding protein
MPLKPAKLRGALAALLLSAAPLWAGDITVMFYSDGAQNEVLTDLVEKYKSVAPDTHITLNLVGYPVIVEQLPGQLEAGTGPDVALVTNLGGLSQYYMDLTPFVDAAAWEERYGAVLPWYRAGREGGIYGWHSELTVTGPYINRTMFEDAGVEVPPQGATWDDWAAATKQVMEKTGSYAAMVMDRSGHRFAGPAMSYGAKYFDAEGHLILDDGFKVFAQKMVDWHKEGLMPPDIWPALSGSKYANGNEMFFGGDVPFYMSGSWNINNVATSVGDKFQWEAVPVPCGPDGCGVMPGGAGFVAFKASKNAEEAAKFVAWLGNDENAAEWSARTFSIPANAVVQKAGVDYAKYGAGEQVAAALKTFTEGAARAKETTPQAYQLQGDKFNFVIYQATVQYLSEVMNGNMSLDDAMARIEADIAEKTKM